jgi:uncharacterized protein (TIGR02246 family)
MRRLCLNGLLASVLCAAAASVFAAEDTAPSDLSAEATAIRASAEKYVASYNRRDSRTMAFMWSPDAVYMDPSTGERISGRDAIAQHFDYIFAGSEDAKLTTTLDSIEFVSPNVAIVKGNAQVSYQQYPEEQSVYSVVLVKQGGQWLMDRITEEPLPAPPPSHYNLSANGRAAGRRVAAGGFTADPAAVSAGVSSAAGRMRRRPHRAGVE